MPGHVDQGQITGVLGEFQRGYIERDVTRVDSYVEELFAEDALVIGTVCSKRRLITSSHTVMAG